MRRDVNPRPASGGCIGKMGMPRKSASDFAARYVADRQSSDCRARESNVPSRTDSGVRVGQLSTTLCSAIRRASELCQRSMTRKPYGLALADPVPVSVVLGSRNFRLLRADSKKRESHDTALGHPSVNGFLRWHCERFAKNFPSRNVYIHVW